MEPWLLLVIVIPLVFAAVGVGLIVLVTRREFGRRRRPDDREES